MSRCGDAAVYFEQARVIRDRGARRGFNVLTRRYMTDAGAENFPSPLRWLWILAVALFGPRLALATHIAAPVALAWAVLPLGVPWWAAALVAAASPLLWIVSRHLLQDGPVSVLFLVAVGFALRGATVPLCLVLTATLAVREVSPLNWPAVAAAWLLRGHDILPLLAAFAGASALWAAGTWTVLRRDAVPVLRRSLSGHGTEYTRRFQRGGLGRLFVDLVALSPIPVVLALQSYGPTRIGTVEFLAIAAHGLAPVVNARNVLGAELLIRAAAVTVCGPWLLLLIVAADAATIIATRKVYDPTTANIADALGFIRG